MRDIDKNKKGNGESPSCHTYRHPVKETLRSCKAVAVHGNILLTIPIQGANFYILFSSICVSG